MDNYFMGCNPVSLFCCINYSALLGQKLVKEHRLATCPLNMSYSFFENFFLPLHVLGFIFYFLTMYQSVFQKPVSYNLIRFGTLFEFQVIWTHWEVNFSIAYSRFLQELIWMRKKYWHNLIWYLMFQNLLKSHAY
jgi:hypothetical protein